MKPTEFAGHQPGTITGELFEKAEDLTEEKHDAYLIWQKAEADLKKMEGKMHIQFESEEKRSVAKIEAMIDADDDHYKAVLDEAAKHADYERVTDKLMTVRQMISFRGF